MNREAFKLHCGAPVVAFSREHGNHLLGSRVQGSGGNLCNARNQR